MNQQAHPTTAHARTTPSAGCSNTHPAYHHLHRVHPSPAATRACTADQCQQGRTACPCPQACELPTDEAPATAHHAPTTKGTLMTIRFTDLPTLGAPFEGGTFIGITTQPDGTHHAVALLPDQGSNLTHPQAVVWAEALGATLPTRPIAALLFANAKDQLRDEWHWCMETSGASYAWSCDFHDGRQGDDHKCFEGSAVAVRCIPLSA